MNHTKMPGFPCPICKGFIPFCDFKTLITSGLECIYCKLELKVDTKQSMDAINAMGKVDQASKNLEEKSHFNR